MSGVARRASARLPAGVELADGTPPRDAAGGATSVLIATAGVFAASLEGDDLLPPKAFAAALARAVGLPDRLTARHETANPRQARSGQEVLQLCPLATLAPP